MLKHLNPTIKTIISCFLLTLLASCDSPETQKEDDTGYTHTLRKVGEYKIQIDSVTAPKFSFYQRFEENNIVYFTMLNRVTQEINFYDMEDLSLAFKIAIPYQGPHAVGNLRGFNSGYHIHNLDSIFVLSRNTGRISMLNRYSEKLVEYDNLRETGAPTAVLPNYAPMYIKNGRAYFTNIQNGMSHFSQNAEYRSDYATVLDLKTHQKTYFLSYPESFTKGTWGIELHRLSWVPNPLKERLIVSYELDPNLYEYDFEGKLLASYPARSSLVIKTRSMTSKDRAPSGHRAYYLEQDRYGQIFFDPYRQIYIRDSRSGIPEEKLEAGDLQAFDRSLILIDKDMNKIGEIPESTKGKLILFFDGKGIHKFVETENEDILKFEIYELVEM